MEERNPIISMKTHNPRRYPELDRYMFEITVSNVQGVCKVFYFEHKLGDDTDITQDIPFIKQIVEYAEVEVRNEGIQKLISVMRCRIFQDPF